MTRHGATDSLGQTSGPEPRAGFSLVELLMAILVGGILTGIAVPRIDAARFQVDATAQEVASVVAGARAKALLKQHDVVLTFDVAGDRLYVLEDLDNSGAAGTGEERRMVQLSGGVKFDRGGATPIRGVTDVISFTKVSESLPSLTFHRNGAASEEGIVYLASGRGAGATTFPGDTRAMTVERATGRVRCFSNRTGQWLERC